MKVTFASQGAASPRLVARVVEQDKMPAGLDQVAAEGARASRFTGKLGQVFESFAAGENGVRRHVLVGIGEPSARAQR